MGELLPGWEVDRRLTGRPDRIVVRARRGTDPPVVVKATVPGATWRARAALRHESRLLDEGRGPGVVELLDVADTRGRTALVLRHVPLAPPPHTDLEALRSTVERLLAMGIDYGPVRAEHVLRTADGELVLCGFGRATRRAGAGRPRSPGARRGGPRRP